MMTGHSASKVSLHAAIACGGTGGHLFPGLAVGRELLTHGVRVTLFISAKEIDRLAVRGVQDMEIVELPSTGLVPGGQMTFLRGLLGSWRIARNHFRKQPPGMVLAMGGFTSAAPILAGRRSGAACFLHDSNALPGRANRFLARFVNETFLGFTAAQGRVRGRVRVTGTPVRPEFVELPAAAARQALGLRAEDPVLLIMGGSQGAAGINRLVVEVLPSLTRTFPRLQFIHLTGAADLQAVQEAYQRLGVKALVQMFSAAMHHTLGAATLAITRAGGSTLAEIAAMRTPAVLIPFPAAAENHQEFNAGVFTREDAALMVRQNETSAPEFGALLTGLLQSPERLAGWRENLRRLQMPDAPGRIVAAMVGSARAKTDGFAAAARRRQHTATSTTRHQALIS